MKKPKLKPCPHCGGKAILQKLKPGSRWIYSVSCKAWGLSCGSPDASKKEIAVQAWNRRKS